MKAKQAATELDYFLQEQEALQAVDKFLENHSSWQSSKSTGQSSKSKGQSSKSP
jgi:hypothetical protein